MRALVHLSAEALADSMSLTALTFLVRHHEVVVACAKCGPAMSVVTALRRVVPTRRVVALLVSGEIALQERRLIEELLAEGTIPLVLTTEDPVAARLVNWMWLQAACIYVLPAEPGGNPLLD
jgi:hypothetical protein